MQELQKDPSSKLKLTKGSTNAKGKQSPGKTIERDFSLPDLRVSSTFLGPDANQQLENVISGNYQRPIYIAQRKTIQQALVKANKEKEKGKTIQLKPLVKGLFVRNNSANKLAQQSPLLKKKESSPNPLKKDGKLLKSVSLKQGRYVDEFGTLKGETVKGLHIEMEEERAQLMHNWQKEADQIIQTTEADQTQFLPDSTPQAKISRPFKSSPDSKKITKVQSSNQLDVDKILIVQQMKKSQESLYGNRIETFQKLLTQVDETRSPVPNINGDLTKVASVNIDDTPQTVLTRQDSADNAILTAMGPTLLEVVEQRADADQDATTGVSFGKPPLLPNQTLKKPERSLSSPKPSQRRSKSVGKDPNASAAPASIPTISLQFPQTNNVTKARDKAIKQQAKQNKNDLKRKREETKSTKHGKDTSPKTDPMKVTFSSQVWNQVQSSKLQAKQFLEDVHLRLRKNPLHESSASPNPTNPQSNTEGGSGTDEPKNKRHRSMPKTPLRRNPGLQGSHIQNQELYKRLQNLEFCEVFIPNKPSGEQVDQKLYLTNEPFNKPNECSCENGNAELMQLLLQSPLLPLVQERAQEALKSEPGKSKTRLDLQVLDKLLNEVLSGKYVVQKDLVQFDKVGLRQSEKYMNGLDLSRLKVSADEISDAAPYEPKISIIKNENAAFVQTSQKWFNLESIAEQEKWIEEVLVQKKDEMVVEQDKFLTLMTQAWKQNREKDKQELVEFINDPMRADCESAFKEWIDSRSVWYEAKPYTKNLGSNQLNVVESIARAKETTFNSKVEYVRTIINDMGKSAEDFFNDKMSNVLFPTLNRDSSDPSENPDEAGIDQALYLCFLEVVRQVSVKSKTLALLLLKIWHSHHEQTHNKVANVYSSVKQQLNQFKPALNKMVQKFQDYITEDQEQDEQIVKMKDRYAKALFLVEISAAELYKAQDKAQKLQQQMDNLNDNLNVLLPNNASYLKDETLHQKLMLRDSNLIIEEEHLLKKFKQNLVQQIKQIPDEAHLVQDLVRLKQVVRSNLPEGFQLIEKKMKMRQLRDHNEMLQNKMQLLDQEIQRVRKENFRLDAELKTTIEDHKTEKRQMVDHYKNEIYKAVLNSKRDQTIDILSNVKEVQTDSKMLMDYFEQLEKMKRLTIGQSLHAKLISLPTNDLNVRKSLKNNPIFIDVHRPILQQMKNVLTGKSEQIVRSHKKTLKVIKEMLIQRVDLLNEPENAQNFLNLDQFYYNWLSQNYGDKEMCSKYAESFMLSFMYWSEKDTRIDNFRRFLGLNVSGRWPFSIFKFYLEALRATNVSMNTLFSIETDLNETFINYGQVIVDFRELLSKISTNAFLRESVYNQLQRVVRVMCPNTTISRLMNVQLYEGYKELNEKITRAKRARSFADMLSLLFTGDTNSITDTQTVPSQLTRNSSSIFPKKMSRDPSSKKSNLGLPIFKRSSNFDLQVLDKDTVSLQELKDFIIDELKLEPNDKSFQVLQQLLDVLVIKGQDVVDQNYIGRLQAVRALSEKIELKISVENFLNIGVQAQISFENQEDQWFERVFAFYSQLFPLQYKGDDIEPDAQLQYVSDKNYDGLEFVQFFIFCKDAGNPKYKDPKVCLLLFSDTVMYYRRQRLGCDNFIELIHKYSLIKSKQSLEETMHSRFAQTKKDMKDFGQYHNEEEIFWKLDKQVQTDTVVELKNQDLGRASYISASSAASRQQLLFGQLTPTSRNSPIADREVRSSIKKKFSPQKFQEIRIKEEDLQSGWTKQSSSKGFDTMKSKSELKPNICQQASDQSSIQSEFKNKVNIVESVEPNQTNEETKDASN